MCRFISYLGPSIVLSSLVSEPSHGLLKQSYGAADKIAQLNADGFGLAWYAPEVSTQPAVFKDVSPAWSNPNLKQLARVTKSNCVLAHVRAGSVGAVTYTNCHPFTFNNFAFMHNGTIAHFSGIKRKLLSLLSDEAFNMIQGHTDSEHVFALFLTNYEHLKEQRVYGAAATDPHAPGAAQLLSDAVSMTVRTIHELQLEFEHKHHSVPYHNPHTSTHFTRQHSHHHNVHSPTTAASSTDASTATATATMTGRTISENFDDSEEGQTSSDLPHTRAVSRLNVCVTDGVNMVVSRYTTGSEDCAHTLYVSTGHKLLFKGGLCKVAKSHEEAVANEVAGSQQNFNGISQTAGAPPNVNADTSASTPKLQRAFANVKRVEEDEKHPMVIVSSEPLDAEYDCECVPPNHMVVAGPHFFEVKHV